MLEDFFIVIQWLKHTRIRLVCVDMDAAASASDSESDTQAELPFPELAESTDARACTVDEHRPMPPRIVANKVRKQSRLTEPVKRAPKQRSMSQPLGR